MKDSRIVIIGAGISGLTTAFWLNRDGYSVKIIEKKPGAGGTMRSQQEEGFLFDHGPNSGLETTPLVRELVEGAGLADEMLYANPEADKRYILRDGTLHPLPTSPPAFIKSKLFSTSAKFRLMLEPFIGRSREGYNQSLADFVKRRLGQEFLDYAINPFVSGVYAGRPEQLSVQSAFPKLWEIEEEYGSLIKGMILGAKKRKKSKEVSKQSAKMFSFKGGMQTLPLKLAEILKDKITYESALKEIIDNGDHYTVVYDKNGALEKIEADVVLTTLPSYELAPIAGHYDTELASHLAEIYYPPVAVLHLGYNKDQIGRPLDGFGFLIPEKEKQPYLGALWNSTIFTGRAKETKACFTLFLGGARNPDSVGTLRKETAKNTIAAFQKTMNISGEPIYKNLQFWERAIPQYVPGYIEHVRYFEKFESENQGFFIGGNFRGGISVSDCIKSSGTTFNRIKEYIEHSL